MGGVLVTLGCRRSGRPSVLTVGEKLADNHIQSPRRGRCWHCGALTEWVEINFEAWLCPGECARAKDEEFWRCLECLPELPDDDPFWSEE